MRVVKHIRDFFYFNELEKYKEKKKIIYLLTPRHGNLGDQMISVATKKILEDFYKNEKIFEIEYDIYRKNKEKIKRYINVDDIIILQGGGNLGDIWNEEGERREILKDYKDNKIIIMPQTITFLKEDELEKSRNIYSKVKDLTIITREEYSYQKGKEIFSNNKVFLVPDSVFYLEDCYVNRFNLKREGALFLLRNDKEKITSNDILENLSNILKKMNINYEISDTQIDPKGNISKYNREKICDILLKKISSKKLIITDRLHGMILSVIMNTPVIIFNSSTKKTVGSLKWIKHLENVSFIYNENDTLYIEKEIKRLYFFEKNKKEFLIKKYMEEKLKKIF